MTPKDKVAYGVNYVLKHCGIIDTVSNLVFWSCLANKLGPWHNV